MKSISRPPRKTWSREIILDAAFRLVDAADMHALTMSRLGQELDGDPSSVYRHFRNKDELLLAMADAVYAEVVAAFTPGDEPLESLRAMSWLMHTTFLRRPGLASVVAARFTGGPAEAEIGEIMVGDLVRMGLDPGTADTQSRALGELVFGHILMTATVMMLDPDQLAFELETSRLYPARIRRHAALRSREEQLVELRAECDAAFEAMLETYLKGLAASAS